MLNFFFGFHGRVRRTHFCLGSLGVGFVGALFGVHSMHESHVVYLNGLDYDRYDVIGSSLPAGLSIVSGLAALACAWATLALAAKRWHDMGATGWLGLLSLIPGINVLIFILLCLLPPSRSDNAYGPDPRFGAAVTA
jgi:uncharacterized membrane protein YhaH (DUF805 family)